jgi:3-dehydroquinate synthetase
MGLTADDLIVATGDADVCSVASYVATQWCAGTTLVTAPTTQLGLVEAAVTPRPMDAGGSQAMLSVRTGVKHVLFDTDVVFDSPMQEDVLMSRVLMVVTAMCDSEKTFERLWDRAEALCAGDAETLCEQLRDTVKTRGKILSSTALALRQSLSYGEAFARALMGLDATVAPSTARAEALRFQARLAAGEGMLAVDDVLAQDELLEMLELPVAQVSIAPDALIEAVRKERFKRSNRFLLGLPRKLGRVRLAAVTDELIAEHVAAWCASREG